LQKRNTPNQVKRDAQQKKLEAKAKSVKAEKRSLKGSPVLPHAPTAIKGKAPHTAQETIPYKQM